MINFISSPFYKHVLEMLVDTSLSVAMYPRYVYILLKFRVRFIRSEINFFCDFNPFLRSADNA